MTSSIPTLTQRIPRRNLSIKCILSMEDHDSQCKERGVVPSGLGAAPGRECAISTRTRNRVPTLHIHESTGVDSPDHPSGHPSELRRHPVSTLFVNKAMRRRNEAVQVSLHILEQCHLSTPGVSKCHGSDAQRAQMYSWRPCDNGFATAKSPGGDRAEMGLEGVDLEAVCAIWIV
jgi:hypothetical protein